MGVCTCHNFLNHMVKVHVDVCKLFFKTFHKGQAVSTLGSEASWEYTSTTALGLYRGEILSLGSLVYKVGK